MKISTLKNYLLIFSFIHSKNYIVSNYKFSRENFQSIGNIFVLLFLFQKKYLTKNHQKTHIVRFFAGENKIWLKIKVKSWF